MTPAPSPLDAELLARLERAFEDRSGGGEQMTLADFKRALDVKSDYLAKRVLDCFDRDRNGVVTKGEFVAGVRTLLYGSDREKLVFAFRVHDHDGDGALDREEVRRMIALSLAESGADERTNQSPEQLVAQLFAVADTNRDGRLSFDELDAVVRKRPALLAQMIRSEAIWLAPNEDLLLAIDERRTRGSLGRLIANRRLQALFGVLWLAANVAVVAWSMTRGRSHETANPVMEVGRALGAALDLNAGLVFIPVMRRFLGRIRASWLARLLPLDDAIDFHKLAGHVLFALALAHSAAFLVAFATGHATSGVLAIVRTERGATGAAWLLVFAVMWLGALAGLRRSKRFELFYFSHLLYIVWLAVAIAHAPRLLLFAGVPLVGFVVESLLRLRRRRPETAVVSAHALRSGVTRLELARPAGFTFGAGDFAFVRIPAIAKHEWHPFTISSAPESANLTFHIRSLGNWTATLHEHVAQRKGELHAYVDGPYGTPSKHIFQARFAVLIGAGIGVTPFASVLESIVLRAGGASPAPSALEKVHFFWLNRDQVSFEWFRGLLSRLESIDRNALVETHLCMTHAPTGMTAFGLELARELMAAAGRSDFFTGLRTRTHTGRPDWESMLGEIAKRHAPAKVDVFFCGPYALARTLEPICHRLGMSFREERF